MKLITRLTILHAQSLNTHLHRNI